MDTRSIKEKLGRIKVYCSRNEIIRALESTISVFKEIIRSGMPPTTEVRALLHENIPLLFYDPLVKKYLEPSIKYQPGQEKEILPIFVGIHKKLVEEKEKETYIETRSRKQKLDKAYNLGITLLKQKHISEADTAFTEALTYYHDEHILFSLIAKALIKANEPIRAGDYVKKGLAVLPSDPEIKKIVNILSRIKAGEASAAEEL